LNAEFWIRLSKFKQIIQNPAFKIQNLRRACAAIVVVEAGQRPTYCYEHAYEESAGLGENGLEEVEAFQEAYYQQSPHQDGYLDGPHYDPATFSALHSVGPYLLVGGKERL
jgi:hypothetical protein